MSSSRKNKNISEGNTNKANLENYRELACKREVRLTNDSIDEQTIKIERQINNECFADRDISSNSIKDSYQLSDLLCKKDDDYNTVVNKNIKLSSLIIQASNKLNQVTDKLQSNEENHKTEKEKILTELEKITLNYQKYAVSFKNYSLLEEQYQKLKNDYEHNYNVLISYQDSIRYIYVLILLVYF